MFSELPHVPPHPPTASKIGRHNRYLPIATNLAVPGITLFWELVLQPQISLSYYWLRSSMVSMLRVHWVLSPRDLNFFTASYEPSTKILFGLGYIISRIDTNLDLSYPTNSISLPTFRLTTSRNLSRSFPIIIF